MVIVPSFMRCSSGEEKCLAQCKLFRFKVVVFCTVAAFLPSVLKEALALLVCFPSDAFYMFFRLRIMDESLQWSSVL